MAVLLLATAAARPLCAQTITGRITDASNGGAVGLAAVVALDADRRPLLMAAAEVDGRYVIELSEPGVYYLFVERLGYFENETPLMEVGSGAYEVDVELRPEPFRMDPLDVSVSNETLEDFLTLRFGQHPASIPGYRSIQGLRLEEAKLKARDNTELLRWLYIPVSHGQVVCINALGAPLPPRGSTGASPDLDPGRAEGVAPSCGALYVDGYRCPNELIEEIDMDRIAVVVTFRGSVHLYTRTFEWTFRRGEGAGAC